MPFGTDTLVIPRETTTLKCREPFLRSSTFTPLQNEQISNSLFSLSLSHSPSHMYPIYLLASVDSMFSSLWKIPFFENYFLHAHELLLGVLPVILPLLPWWQGQGGLGSPQSILPPWPQVIRMGTCWARSSHNGTFLGCFYLTGRNLSGHLSKNQDHVRAGLTMFTVWPCSWHMEKACIRGRIGIREQRERRGVSYGILVCPRALDVFSFPATPVIWEGKQSALFTLVLSLNSF